VINLVNGRPCARSPLSPRPGATVSPRRQRRGRPGARRERGRALQRDGHARQAPRGRGRSAGFSSV